MTSNSPSPVLLFPSASPTPKLTCHSPSKKPPSPFDWPRECLTEEDRQLSMHRRHSCVASTLSHLREKVNLTPDDHQLLQWLDNLPPAETTKQQQKRASSLLGHFFSRMKRAAGKPFQSHAHPYKK